MPAKSPEAIKRKRENRRKADLSKKLKTATIKPSDFSAQKIIKRRMLGPCTLSKTELREMLSKAVQNTK